MAVTAVPTDAGNWGVFAVVCVCTSVGLGVRVWLGMGKGHACVVGEREREGVHLDDVILPDGVGKGGSEGGEAQVRYQKRGSLAVHLSELHDRRRQHTDQPCVPASGHRRHGCPRDWSWNFTSVCDYALRYV